MNLKHKILIKYINSMDKSKITPRIMKVKFIQESQKLQSEPIVGIYAEPYPNNFRAFKVRIAGPQDSPYEGKMI